MSSNLCFHVTTRCNNREFRLTRHECRQVFLYVLKKAIVKFDFKLYGICIMSNHVHYLLMPEKPNQLSQIMHWVNWYLAMCFNRMLNRTGHFWEKRYYSSSFEMNDHQRALNTLRYIHGNPKSANMQQGFFYDFSNYGTHERLTDDGLTVWHPAFLALGESLDECAEKYKGFCQKYQPKPKSEKRYHWGSKLLPKIIKGQKNQEAKGQLKLNLPSWNDWTNDNTEITEVAEKFVRANCYDWKVASQKFKK